MSDLVPLNATVFPPTSGCWINATLSSTLTQAACVVTPEMINFLNFTTTPSNYIQAYCNNPPGDDSCPFGFCANSDIAGPLQRIATYISNLCLAILVMYSPEEVTESFWAQVLTNASLIISSVLAIAKHNLTKFHAIIAAEIIGSPLTFYLTIYAILSFFPIPHRLHATMGPGRWVERMAVLFTSISWMMLAIYIYWLSNDNRFAQASCDERTPSLFVVKDFLLSAFSVFLIIAKVDVALIAVVLGPVALVVASWGFCIWLQRRQIWPEGEPWQLNIWAVWTVIGETYPFLHFVSVIVIPFAYWVATVEVGLIGSSDNQFSVSFGQILALFVIVPPLISVVKTLPRLWYWFIDLAWVRLITFRPQRATKQVRKSLIVFTPHSGSVRSSIEKSRDEKGDLGMVSSESLGATTGTSRTPAVITFKSLESSTLGWSNVPDSPRTAMQRRAPRSPSYAV